MLCEPTYKPGASLRFHVCRKAVRDDVKLRGASEQPRVSAVEPYVTATVGEIKNPLSCIQSEESCPLMMAGRWVQDSVFNYGSNHAFD
jgi:hypothetical protein